MLVHSKNNPIILNEGLGSLFKNKKVNNKFKSSNKGTKIPHDIESKFANWIIENTDKFSFNKSSTMIYPNPNDESEEMKLTIDLIDQLKRNVAWEQHIPITILRFTNKNNKKADIAFISKSWNEMIDPDNKRYMGIPVLFTSMPIEKLLNKLKEGKHNKPITEISLGVEIYWSSDKPEELHDKPIIMNMLCSGEIF